MHIYYVYSYTCKTQKGTTWYLESNVESEIEKELHHFHSPVCGMESICDLLSKNQHILS